MKQAPFVFFVSLFCSSTLFAQDFQFVGKIQQPVNQEVQQVVKAQAMKSHPQEQVKNMKLPGTITVLKVQLSDHAWENLHDKTEAASVTDKQMMPLSMQTSSSQSSVQLGMNNLPIFDQGPHGTCVTFAASAAISAVLNQGDYISELCQLQLGQYLEQNGYTLSGWNGSYGTTVLNQMQSFGIVTKETQFQQGCGGYKAYPVDTVDEPTEALSLVDYHPISQSFPKNIGWSVVLDQYQVFSDKVSPDTTLQQVKNALKAGDRLMFGVMLFRMDQGVAGAVGRYRAANDTWVLTPEIVSAILSQDTEVGGHEMIITGYDDNAKATDSKGRVYKGILTLRNSWGSAYGDEGTFYMSYDYFKTLTLDVLRIRKLY
jgi:hypothetical protein